MRKLSYREALVLYDGLQVFVGEDQFGTRYVCTLFEQTDLEDKYLCSPVSPRRLKELTDGRLELREVYSNPESDEVELISISGQEIRNRLSTTLKIENIHQEWLPESGFYLRLEKPPQVEVVEEAHERQRAIIHYKLDPPEARGESKISAENLSQAAKLVQRLVKYAFQRSVRRFDKDVRNALSLPENYELQIFSFSPGSFTVHMQSEMPADMLGYVQLSKALDVIDAVTARVSDPNETVEIVSQQGGHFATAYKDLLKFISETETHHRQFGGYNFYLYYQSNPDLEK